MPAVVTKRLYMIFGLSNGKNLSVSLLDPKTTLTATNVQTVMEALIDMNAFLYNGATAASIVDAYVREVSTTEII